MATTTSTSASSASSDPQPTSTSTSLGSLSSASTSSAISSSSLAQPTTLLPAPSPAPPQFTEGSSATGKTYKPGVVAGISIGTAIAGAILAAIILLFVMRSQKKKRSSSQALTQRAGGSGTHNARPPAGLRRDGQNGGEKPLPLTNMDLVLPQPLDDASVGDEVDKLRKLIQDHVDSNYYHDQPTRNAVHETRLSSILPAAVAILQGQRVEELLDSEQTRFKTLKSVIAAEVLAAINPQGDQRQSLLPQIITSFMASLDERLRTHKTDIPPEIRLSLSRWRVSTHMLLGHQLSDENKLRLERSALALVQKLDVVLLPFADPKTEQARREHLLGVCKRAERVGMLLFSQPAEWSFDWSYLPRVTESSDGRQQGKKSIKSMVVFPGLVRLTDNSTRKLDRPRVVLEPRVKG